MKVSSIFAIVLVSTSVVAGGATLVLGTPKAAPVQTKTVAKHVWSGVALDNRCEKFGELAFSAMDKRQGNMSYQEARKLHDSARWVRLIDAAYDTPNYSYIDNMIREMQDFRDRAVRACYNLNGEI